MEPGRDYIGVGWAPSCRTPGIGSSWHSVTLTTARNEAETWEFPGGVVAYGELLATLGR